jgi:hypothetical protein
MQGKVIGLVMNNVQQILQRAAAAVHVERPAPSSDASQAVMPMASTIALTGVRFRAIVDAQLTPVLSALNDRGTNSEYLRLMTTIEGAFCTVRTGAIMPLVQTHIAELQSQLSLRELARCSPTPPAALPLAAPLHSILLMSYVSPCA